MTVAEPTENRTGDMIALPSGSMARLLGRWGNQSVLLELIDRPPPGQMVTSFDSAGLTVAEFLALRVV